MSKPNEDTPPAGFVVAMDRRAERAELQRILALPAAERDRELERRARARDARASEYARRELDRLMAHDD